MSGASARSRSCSSAGVTRKASRCPRGSPPHGSSSHACAWRRRSRHGRRSPGRVKRATVLDCGRGPGLPTGGKAQEFPQSVDQVRLENPGDEPPLGLLVGGFPGREVVGQHLPGRPGPQDPTQRVEDLPKIVVALRSVSADERQIGGDEGPFFGTDVAWVRLTRVHARKLHYNPAKFITRSSAIASSTAMIVDFLSIFSSFSVISAATRTFSWRRRRRVLPTEDFGRPKVWSWPRERVEAPAYAKV